MVDYTRATGASGTMLIRDLGRYVEFHVRSADGATNTGSMPWNFNVNGAYGERAASYPSGSPWVHLATFDVQSTQDIKFGLGATGTRGLGGPTDFWQRIDRGSGGGGGGTPARRPDAPRIIGFESVTHSGMIVRFEGLGDGGSPVTGFQYQASDKNDFANVPAAGAPTNGRITRTDLSPGKTYYWRVRALNAVGASDWSAVASQRTLAGLRVKQNGVWKDAVLMVKVNGVWRDAVPYVKQNGVWKASSVA